MSSILEAMKMREEHPETIINPVGGPIKPNIPSPKIEPPKPKPTNNIRADKNIIKPPEIKDYKLEAMRYVGMTIQSYSPEELARFVLNLSEK